MGIEGQFVGLTARIRTRTGARQEGRGKGYLYDIRRFAMLERDQEYGLAKRWREHGDRDAANQLVNKSPASRRQSRHGLPRLRSVRSPKSSPKAMSA